MSVAVCNPVLETESIKYSVQPGCGWLDEGYYRATYNARTRRGQVHSGCDINDVKGGDSDLGNRVRACADGVVVAAGDYPSWGGIVLIHHPALGVWSQYAHMTNIPVKSGQTVQMGDPIGKIGKGAEGQFWAHLHFEVRRSLLPPDFWPSTRFPSKAGAEAYIREHYLDPEKWLEEHNALRTLDDVRAARGELAPVEVPVKDVTIKKPPAVRVEAVPATPPARALPLGWEPVRDATTKRPLPGRYVSIQRNARTGEYAVFEVESWKLKEKGLI